MTKLTLTPKESIHFSDYSENSILKYALTLTWGPGQLPALSAQALAPLCYSLGDFFKNETPLTLVSDRVWHWLDQDPTLQNKPDLDPGKKTDMVLDSGSRPVCHKNFPIILWPFLIRNCAFCTLLSLWSGTGIQDPGNEIRSGYTKFKTRSGSRQKHRIGPDLDSNPVLPEFEILCSFYFLM